VKKRERTEVTVEIDRLLVIRKTSRPVSGWCAECAEQVRLLTPEAAATAAGVSVRTIYRRVEARELHFTETAEGRLLICLTSILK
jgi:hypothetical protein